MKITYNENPFKTTVELDEYEKKELWYKIKIEELEEKIYTSKFYLTDKKYFDVNEAKERLCLENIDERCDKLLEYYINDLMSVHIGDCICFACSCTKCHAESLLGIDTIKDLSKHSATKIDYAFNTLNKNLEETIDYLLNYEPIKEFNPKIWKSKENYEKYIPKWKEDEKKGADWLINYKQKYLNQ